MAAASFLVLAYAVRQVEGAQLATGFADGVDLGMGGGVVVEGDAVGSAGDDFTIFHDDGAKRASTIFHTLVGQPNGLAHKDFILFSDFHDSVF